MTRSILVALVLVFAGCSSPSPVCSGDGFPTPTCGEGFSPDWFPLCSGGFDADRFNALLPGTTFPSCDTGVPVCASGAAPTCELDPWSDVRHRYVECFDGDEDGVVGAHEGPSYESGHAVVCGDFGWHCTDEATGETVDDGGFSCSSSANAADHRGITIECGARGELARCVRSNGETLPSDLDLPRCLVPAPIAAETCG